MPDDQVGGDGGLVIVSKLETFSSSAKVIWIRLGNCSTTDIVRLLSERHGDIGRFLANEEVAFLALA